MKRHLELCAVALMMLVLCASFSSFVHATDVTHATLVMYAPTQIQIIFSNASRIVDQGWYIEGDKGSASEGWRLYGPHNFRQNGSQLLNVLEDELSIVWSTRSVDYWRMHFWVNYSEPLYAHIWAQALCKAGEDYIGAVFLNFDLTDQNPSVYIGLQTKQAPLTVPPMNVDWTNVIMVGFGAVASMFLVLAILVAKRQVKTAGSSQKSPPPGETLRIERARSRCTESNGAVN